MVKKVIVCTIMYYIIVISTKKLFNEVKASYGAKSRWVGFTKSVFVDC